MAFIGTPLDTRNTFQSLVGKRFSGDGSTTAFTLDVAPSSTLDIEVFVGNVRQDPNSAYTLSGTTLSFTGAPPSGTNNIYVVHQAKSVGTIDVPALGVSTASIQADAITEAKIADDAVESEHLNNNVISGQTELAATPADTDELLISDAGTIKRIDFSHIKATDNSPAFHAYANSSYIAIADDTYTTLACPNEAFDIGSAYNTSNYRFIPQTAGKYFCYANVVWDGNVNSQGAILLQKNQSFSNPDFFRNTNYATSTSGVHVSGTFDMNGSSDYIEARVYHNQGGSVNLRNQGNENFFGGFLVTTST